MKFSLFALAAFAAAHAGHDDHDHDHDHSDEPSDVVVLTDSSFKTFITENPLSLIEFYAPWCGHCKQLKPEYERAATELLEKVALAKVDCTVEKVTCEEYGVQGFPTLKIFRDGATSDYKGQRTSTSIVETMKKQLLPAVSELSAKKDLEALTEDNKVVVVGFFAEGSKERQVFDKVASALRDDYIFAATTSEKLIKAKEVVAPAVVLYKKFDEGKNTFDGKYEKEALSEFVKVSATPVMDDIGPQNYEKYMSMGLPMGYFFYATPEQKAEHGPAFEAVAKSQKGKINFVYLDANLYGAHADNVGLKQGEWPAFALHDTVKNEKFPYDQTKALEASEIKKLVDGFASGSLKPTLKSEEIPETNDESVKVVVGKSFKSIVLDEKKDVLIEFYARKNCFNLAWCGHCKQLAPKWEELGTDISKKTSDIVIAKCDATANDVPVDIQGFPTIILFKANSNERVSFNGERTVESFKEFLVKNAVHGELLAEAGESAESSESSEEKVEREEL
ncbi:protein disulfide-isomerase precursor [Terramyces sp. JEL0728]|nr:protein disulfide-isomerase precursor [Terramyces sp. JEL0728]